ncbi:MFS transporter [Salinigranum halophilum]|uniref:MFS transporter n=1 Tax=Salinigranum halophilum TaxID=2565931 RepID=UPI001F2F712E|nr:MFS transporter [Salinigranum halophilum]
MARTTRRLPRRALATLGTGLFGLGVAVGSYGAVVSLLIDRGVAPDAAGFGMTLFLLMQGVAALPADRLTRVVSVPRACAAGFALTALGALVGGWATLPAALASRALLGVGQGVAFVASMKYVGRRVPDRTATAQGLLGALFTLGFAVGLASAPGLLERVGPVVPAVGAAALIGGGALGTVTLPDVRTDAPVPMGAYLAPLRTPTGLALGLGNMATFGFLMVAGTWYPDVLRGAGVPVTATLVGFSLATVAGRAVGGRLSERVGDRRTVLVSFVGSVVVLALLALALRMGTPWLLAATIVGTGLGFGVPFGPLFALAFSELADDAGVTLVAMILVGNVGAVVYPWLLGRTLLDTDSFALGFVAMAATVLAVALLWLSAIGTDAPTVTRPVSE